MAVIFPDPNGAVGQSIMGSARVPGVGFAGCRALILDPSLTSRRLLHDILVDLRCTQVGSVANMGDAWAELRKGGINLVFLDWSADMDALGILAMLRAPASPERYVPVVVVASYSGVDDVLRARDAGATEFMLRPFSREVVASRLRAIVRMPRPFVESDSFFGPDRRRHHLQWDKEERRRQRHPADRRDHADPAYAGPERRLERVAAPDSPPLATARGSDHVQ